MTRTQRSLRSGVKRSNPRCKWCGKKHRISESLCYAKNEEAIRSRHRPRVKTVSEVYVDGRIRPPFILTDMEGILVKRQADLAKKVLATTYTNGFKPPRNIERFLADGFIWSQIATQKPWAVYVLIDGKRRRKKCNNLWEAVEYLRKVKKKYPSAGVVSLARSYSIPTELAIKRDRLPKKFKWCPQCADFRVFRRVDPPVRFSAHVKVWRESKGKYEFTDRMLWLTECQLCGSTNRPQAFRNSNQPYEVRRIKKGVTRVKRRHTSTTVGKKRRR